MGMLGSVHGMVLREMRVLGVKGAEAIFIRRINHSCFSFTLKGRGLET